MFKRNGLAIYCAKNCIRKIENSHTKTSYNDLQSIQKDKYVHQNNSEITTNNNQREQTRKKTNRDHMCYTHTFRSITRNTNRGVFLP